MSVGLVIQWALLGKALGVSLKFSLDITLVHLEDLHGSLHNP